MASSEEIILCDIILMKNIIVILGKKRETKSFRELYNKCLEYLQKVNKETIETNAQKGIRTVTKAVSRLIGGIPVVKEG